MWPLIGLGLAVVGLALALCRVASRTDRLEERRYEHQRVF